MFLTPRSVVKTLLGRRLAFFIRRGLFGIPRLLWAELRFMLTSINAVWEDNDDEEVLLAQLRTMAHILDKGLQADSWEAGRGKVVYKIAAELLGRLQESDLASDPSYEWALQRIRAYEQAQRTKAPCFEEYISIKDAPQPRENLILQVIHSRRSVRSFVDKPLDSNVLKGLVEVVNWAPTSCNRQPAKLYITQDPMLTKTCLQQCAGATCFSEVVPCFIAVCSDIRCYVPEDRNLAFIDVMGGIQNMLLLAHTYGIGGTLLNWMRHTRKEEQVLRETLGIPQYYRILMNLVIGYAKECASAPGRKGVNLTYVVIKRVAPQPVCDVGKMI